MQRHTLHTTHSLSHSRRLPTAAVGRPGSRSRPSSARVRAQNGTNPLTAGAVSLATEVLRLLGVGKGRAREVASLKQRPPLRRGDVRGVMARIRADYANAYFVTGVIDGSVYEEDCLFVDPTISFSGLDLWRRNLQLLVPFLVAPTVQLKGLQRLARNDQGREVLKAEWRLTTGVALPWQPLVYIGGATEYVLNSDANKVESHTESWSVSGTEAVLQLLRPAKRQNPPENAAGKRKRASNTVKR